MKRLSLLFALGLLTVCGAAELSFDETLKEVHVPPDEKQVVTDFVFENKTDKPVTIARYDSTCSCMSVQVKGGKLIYQPGEKGVLRANFDMGNFSGTVDKAVQLWLKGDPASDPSVKLTVRVHIPVIVNVEPKTLRWEVGAEPEPIVVSIVTDYEKPIKVLSAECGSDAFDIEVKTVEDGKKYEMVVTPKTTETPSLGVIQITTDCPIPRHATQRAFALVRQPVPGEKK